MLSDLMIPTRHQKIGYNRGILYQEEEAMPRKLRVEWKEDAATLKALYLKEKHRTRRERLQALWHLREGKKVMEVAAMLGRAPRTVSTWVAWYRRGGLQEVLERRQGGVKRPSRRRLTDEQVAALKAKAEEGAFRRVHDVVEWVAQEYGVHYTDKGMYTLLRRLGWRKKVPRPRHTHADPKAQEAWKKGGFMKP